MKTLGIFTAYSPNTRFAQEGLGRYLATFLKAGAATHDVRFVVACPSWSRAAFTTLFTSFGIDRDEYSFIGPARDPILLTFRGWLHERVRRRKRTGRKVQRQFIRPLAVGLAGHLRRILARMLGSRSVPEIAAIGLYLAVGALVALPFVAVALPIVIVSRILSLIGDRIAVKIRRPFRRLMRPIRRAFILFDRHLVASLVYRSMLQREIASIVSSINKRKDITAWYASTALWPEVHDIAAPKLICLPDVVLSEFPVPFAQMGEHLRLTYDAIRATMSRPAHFVTFSEHIKWTVAVERFGVAPQAVSVVHHAANDLKPLLDITGFPDLAGTGENFSRQLLASAIEKRDTQFRQGPERIDFKYLFYASQFRPSKNTLTLLRAYAFVLRKRFHGHKLLLTGNPAGSPDIVKFVRKHNLVNDVVFLPGLNDRELAAAYSLADLAVNPSLSEGGMPFTLTEALSVGTPVIMGDIAVTREILTDPDLASATLFDPYDWRALADKIEWALSNREALYARQRAFYDQNLATRRWDDVVAEHIALLDRMAEAPHVAG